MLGQVSFPEFARTDTWVETGVEVSAYYDSLLAKLMVHGDSRPDAISKLQTALDETQVGAGGQGGHRRWGLALAALLAL